VSNESWEFLRKSHEWPMIDVSQLNPDLYEQVERLKASRVCCQLQLLWTTDYWFIQAENSLRSFSAWMTGPRCARAPPAHIGLRCARTNHTTVRKQTVRFLQYRFCLHRGCKCKVLLRVCLSVCRSTDIAQKPQRWTSSFSIGGHH